MNHSCSTIKQLILIIAKNKAFLPTMLYIMFVYFTIALRPSLAPPPFAKWIAQMFSTITLSRDEWWAGYAVVPPFGRPTLRVSKTAIWTKSRVTNLNSDFSWGHQYDYTSRTIAFILVLSCQEINMNITRLYVFFTHSNGNGSWALQKLFLSAWRWVKFGYYQEFVWDPHKKLTTVEWSGDLSMPEKITNCLVPRINHWKLVSTLCNHREIT